MNKERSLLWPCLWALALSLSFITSVTAQKKDGKKEPPTGTPVLWRAPEDISARDLSAGPGGAEMQPDLSNVTFIEKEGGGHSVKYHVKDGAGREWSVKLGHEVRPETAAVRLVWAVGYVTEVNYFVPCVHIKGAPKPDEPCEGDGFANVRFEARPDDVKRLDTWAWKKNPFVGTKELKGLVVLMALLNNWDLKDINNKVLLVKNESGENELHYIISDLGATFGKTGNIITHSRNEPEKYVKTKFVERTEGDRVRFAFHGKQGELLNDITVEDAKWIGALLAQLSDKQLADAFRAANFTPEEVDMLTAEVRARIDELNNLPGRPVADAAPPAPPSH